jgi:hypothetical protein
MSRDAIISLEGTGGGGHLYRNLEIFELHGREYGLLLKLEEQSPVIMQPVHRDGENIFSVIGSLRSFWRSWRTSKPGPRRQGAMLMMSDAIAIHLRRTRGWQCRRMPGSSVY